MNRLKWLLVILLGVVFLAVPITIMKTDSDYSNEAWKESWLKEVPLEKGDKIVGYESPRHSSTINRYVKKPSGETIVQVLTEKEQINYNKKHGIKSNSNTYALLVIPLAFGIALIVFGGILFATDY